MRRLKISRSAFDEVDWEINGAAVKKVEPRNCVSIRKLIWDKLPTGAKLERRGYREGIN